MKEKLGYRKIASDICKIVLLCVACAVISTPAYPFSRKSTDDIPLTHSYFYRLINRSLTISPSKYSTDNVKPVSIREAAMWCDADTHHIPERLRSFFRKHVNEKEYRGDDFLWNPLRRVSFSGVSSAKEDILIMSNYGERFQGRHYFTLNGTGNVFLKDFSLLSYELRVKNDHEGGTLELYQYAFKKGLKHLSLNLAKGSFLLGPGYFGKILLSDNVEPEHTALIKTEIPYDWGALGAFRWYLWHIWYDDDDRVNKDPKLFGMRFSLKPFDVFECALNRVIYYGGSGNPHYKSIKDLWKLFTAEEENTTSKWDTDQFASVDMTFNLSFIKKLRACAGGKLYTEHAWNDIVTPYQPEDGLGRGEDRFDLLGESHIYGIFLTTGSLDVRFEYTKTTRYVYDNHNFSPEGYSDNGYVIGHYIGKDARASFCEIYYEADDAFHLYVSGARIKRGAHLASENEQIQKEFGVGVRYFHIHSLECGVDLKYIKRDRKDTDSSPVGINFIDQKESEAYVKFTASYWLW
ncbi:MAG: capsule assembly Wzi family protein [bacterium]